MTIYRKVQNQITVADINAASFDYVRDHVLIDRFRQTFNRNPEEFIAPVSGWVDKTGQTYWTPYWNPIDEYYEGEWTGSGWAAVEHPGGGPYVLTLVPVPPANTGWSANYHPARVKISATAEYSNTAIRGEAPGVGTISIVYVGSSNGIELCIGWAGVTHIVSFYLYGPDPFTVTQIEFQELSGEWIDVTGPDYWDPPPSQYAEWTGDSWLVKNQGTYSMFGMNCIGDWYIDRVLQLMRITFTEAASIDIGDLRANYISGEIVGHGEYPKLMLNQWAHEVAEIQGPAQDWHITKIEFFELDDPDEGECASGGPT